MEHGAVGDGRATANNSDGRAVTLLLLPSLSLLLFFSLSQSLCYVFT